MLQQPEPEDYVLATGAAHSIRDFLSAAFEAVELDWREHVEQDPRYMRPAEVTHLVGNASKAESKLGWKAATTLNDLAERMVRHDLQLYSNQARQNS
jgi:GDPmannose 4,6-dehydratase